MSSSTERARPELRLSVLQNDWPRCPFYGMKGAGLSFTPTYRNQCGLVREGSRCKMKDGSQDPEWDGCKFFNIPENSRYFSVLESNAVFRINGISVPAKEHFKKVLGRVILDRPVPFDSSKVDFSGMTPTGE